MTASRLSSQPERDEDLPLVLMMYGLFQHERFIELLTGYVTFARTEDGLVKRLAKPHQYFAVSEAVGKTIEAVRSHGRAGVVWHTQGSGKSMEMELYANQVLTHPSLGNPTIVVLTDRTDLDDQLYDTFQVSELLPEKPLQIATRDELRAELANKRTGGIVFTTLQKFGRTKAERDSGAAHPLLVGPAEHHRDRRRGAPQSLRRPGRVRAAPARRAAVRDDDRVHRDADLGRPTGTRATCSATTSTSTT